MKERCWGDKLGKKLDVIVDTIDISCVCCGKIVGKIIDRDNGKGGREDTIYMFKPSVLDKGTLNNYCLRCYEKSDKQTKDCSERAVRTGRDNQW